MNSTRDAVNPAMDVIVAGGGLVGASCAVAMGQLGLATTVLEASPVGSADQPSFDARTVALTLASKRIFDGLGVWPLLDPGACHPIDSIHVSDRGHFGSTRLDRADVGREALGYVVANRDLGNALYRRLEQLDSIRVAAPCQVHGLQPAAPAGRGGGTPGPVTVLSDRGAWPADLLVIADGGRSALSAEAGLSSRAKRYAQEVIVARVDSARAHRAQAFERFTAAGPIALLPIAAHSFALAWTLEAADAVDVAQLEDRAFLDALQAAFGSRAGRFVDAGARRRYPLALTTMAQPVRARVVALGNAAHTVHPVAGQGFNLGLRDVAALAAVLARSTGDDPGNRALLERYRHERRRDARAVAAFTDGLLTIFGDTAPATVFGRNLALSALNLMPRVRRELLMRTMGLRARPNRLLRGAAPVATRTGPGDGSH
jgi:2-octaprenyl-6-methoxyphenol hydroxylase